MYSSFASIIFQISAAATVTVAGYAIFLVITIISVRLLWRGRHSATSFGRRALLPYTLLMLLLGTAAFSFQMYLYCTNLGLKFVQSGPDTKLVVLASGFCTPSALAVDLVSFVIMLTSDVFLIYRAYVIVQKRLLFIALPALLFVASSTLVVLLSAHCATKLAGRPPVLAGLNVVPTLAWLAVNMTLNLIVTTTIVLHIWPARRTRISARERVSSVIAMLTESAAAYTAGGLFFFVALAAESDWSIVFQQIYGISAFLSFSAISLRIALGIDYVPPTVCSGDGHPFSVMVDVQTSTFTEGTLKRPPRDAV